jgi:hypothetical protein
MMESRRTKLAPRGAYVLSALAVAAAGCMGNVGKGVAGGTGGDDPGGGGGIPGIIDNGTGGMGAGGDSGMVIPCTPGDPPVTTRFFRLTHAQYENTVRALTGLDVRPAADFPADQNQAGFNRGIDLQVGDALGKGYRSTAETLAEQIAGNQTAFQKVVVCSTADEACARSFIAAFGRKVYRRLLTDAEKAGYLGLYNMGAALVDGTADNHHKGVQVVLQAMLQAPSFLYRVELANQASGGLIPLGSFEIASRLSFMLVNGPPDDELLDAAERNELTTVEAVTGQARRLLALPAARDTVKDFHRQWLQTDDYANKLTKDTTRFPSVTPDLAPILAEETERFVEAVSFDMGKGFLSLMTAPFTFVNRTTAPLYGVSGTFGTGLTRADLDPTRRAGLLTQIGFLATHAYTNQSSPIHRGTFVVRSVLCGTLPDPPPMVPELPPLGATQTTRQQVDAHTAPDGCKNCHHAIINPVGFGFENYDAVGQYRTMENGADIDATGFLTATAAKAAFTDAISESRLIAESPEGRRCYAATWTRYAYGRAETAGDSCALGALATNLGSDDYKVTDLLVDLTRTKAFMYRAPGGQP